MKSGGFQSKQLVVQDVAQCLNRSEEILGRCGMSKSRSFKNLGDMFRGSDEWVADDHDLIIPDKWGVKCRNIGQKKAQKTKEARKKPLFCHDKP